MDQTGFGWRFWLVFSSCGLLSTGCRKKPVAAAGPGISPEAAGYIAQGDESLRDQHLYGWRKAEPLYRRAYELAAVDEIRKKLLLTRFLILIREIDEDIPYPDGDEVIQQLCAGDAFQKTLCGIAEWFKNGKKAADLKLNAPIFRGEDAAIEGYLNLLFFQATPTVDAFRQSVSPDQPDRKSPLFLYLNPQRLSSADPAELKKSIRSLQKPLNTSPSRFTVRKNIGRPESTIRKRSIPARLHARARGARNIYYYALEDYDQ